MVLPIKIADIADEEAAKRTLERITLEEQLTGDRVRLDPKPSFSKFVEQLGSKEPTEAVLSVLDKLRRPIQYVTKREVRAFRLRGAKYIKSHERLANMVNTYGTEVIGMAPLEVAGAWLRSRPELSTSLVSDYARRPDVSVGDVLALVPRIEVGKYIFPEHVFAILVKRLPVLTAEEDMAIRVAYCNYLQAMVANHLPDRLEKYPRKLVDGNLVIELPTPNKYTLKQLLEGYV